MSEMTLAEAIEKYDKVVAGMHCFDPAECQFCAEDKLALDAAVKDVAVAALRAGYAANCEEKVALDEAELDRHWPDKEGDTMTASDSKERVR